MLPSKVERHERCCGASDNVCTMHTSSYNHHSPEEPNLHDQFTLQKHSNLNVRAVGWGLIEVGKIAGREGIDQNRGGKKNRGHKSLR